MKIKDICFIGIFTSLIILLAQLSIPTPFGVPITIQTTIIMLSGIILGSKKGAIATANYIILGSIGLPVFAGFSGGIGHIMGPTGGFILSFPIMAFLAGLGFFGIIIGIIFNFISGMLWFAFVTQNSIDMAFYIAVLPFIPMALLDMIVLTIIRHKICTKGVASWESKLQAQEWQYQKNI